MNSCHYCRIEFGVHMREYYKGPKLKLTSKHEKVITGTETFVYNDRVTVFTTQNACCGSRAKILYLESISCKTCLGVGEVATLKKPAGQRVQRCPDCK